MRYIQTDQFREAFAKLPQSIQRRAKKQLALFFQNYRYPSLQTKKMEGNYNLFQREILMRDIPFNEGTQIYQIFQILSDCKWHCGKHELPGTQPAKPIQIIRQNGYEVENGRFLCQTCGYKTVHRRLVSTTPTGDVIVRSALPEKLKKRVKKLYNNIEAITQRTHQSAELEVDHRFPQVRWSSPEDLNDPDMPDQEIFEKFQLLTRQNNLWKSRYCENCMKTGKRGTFIGIEYFAQGGPTWPEDIAADDERGCYGCFWYNPDEWRRSLNKLIARNQ